MTARHGNEPSHGWCLRVARRAAPRYPPSTDGTRIVIEEIAKDLHGLRFRAVPGTAGSRLENRTPRRLAVAHEPEWRFDGRASASRRMFGRDSGASHRAATAG